MSNVSKVVSAVKSMFTTEQVDAAKAAINHDIEGGTKWAALATAVRPMFANEKAYHKVKAAVMAELIAPAIPDALAIEKANAALPRKGSDEYVAECEKNPDYAAQWAAIRKADASQRAKRGVYFNRLGAELFKREPTDAEKKKAAKKAKQPKVVGAKILKKAAELLALIQKDEKPIYRHADATRIAQSLVSALTPIDLTPNLNAERGSGKRRTK